MAQLCDAASPCEQAHPSVSWGVGFDACGGKGQAIRTGQYHVTALFVVRADRRCAVEVVDQETAVTKVTNATHCLQPQIPTDGHRWRGRRVHRVDGLTRLEQRHIRYQRGARGHQVAHGCDLDAASLGLQARARCQRQRPRARHIDLALGEHLCAQGIRRRQSNIDIALGQRLGVQRHRLAAGDFHKDAARVSLGHDLLGVDLQKGVLRTNALGCVHVQQTQVHVHLDTTAGRHGQSLGIQVQGVQVQVQVGKPGRLTEHHIHPRHRQAAQLCGQLWRLQIQTGNTRPAHGVVLPGEHARQETHRPIAGGDTERTGLTLGIGGKLDAFVKDHFLGPLDDQLTPIAQHHGI